MTRTTFRLALALVLSLLLHISPFIGGLVQTPPAAPPTPPIQAALRPAAPAAPAASTVPLELEKKPPAPPVAQKQETPRRNSPNNIKSTKTWTQEVRKQFNKQLEDGLFYPAEAIARGLEGEVVVLMLLDERGQVSAARVEQGSGQAILDAAALRAVRSLHSLPADAPRETLLPVRFRLK